MAAKRGRPSKYREEFAGQAFKLCLLGATDEQIAWFFGVTLAEIAEWAWEHKVFFDAITPTEEQVAAYRAKCQANRDRTNLAKRRRRAASISERVLNALRARLWAALKGRSDGALFRRLGYTEAELIAHLESRFRAGMTWENYGRWHVDHIRPCALFDQSDPAQFALCWALSNLQPLWAGENLRKGARHACP